LHCKGSVVAGENRFEIAYIPRPRLSVVSQDFKANNGRVYQREDICSGVEDHLVLSVQGMHFLNCDSIGTINVFARLLTGQGPFHVPYRHTHKAIDGHKETSMQTLRFAQDHGALHLSSIPGEHTYDVMAVGDHAYPLSGDKKIDKTPIYTFTQKVNLRPRATVESPKKPSLCLNDTLKKGSADSSVVHLRGEPPFAIDIEILPPGSRKPVVHTINDILSHKWPISLPDHVFTVPGTHRLRVAGIRDASKCAAEVSEDDIVSMDIDVVEPASIMAVDRRKHHCVGDMLDFVLQGEMRC
jgi:nucleoporin POM152